MVPEAPVECGCQPHTVPGGSPAAPLKEMRMPPRKLSLKREELRDLSTDELTSVVGGTRDTWFSCYTFISCNPLDCLPTFDRECIQ